MADGYDRFENEGNGGGSFVMGLLTGTVLGAGLGILFAPKSGSELRNQLSEQAGSLANQASEGVRKVTDSAGEWADRGREIYGKAKDAVVKGADEAQRYARDTANTVKEAAAKGADEAQTYARDAVNTATAYASGTDRMRGSSSEQTRGQSDNIPPTGSSTSGSRRS
jgi:gas vesicle protein